MIQEEEESKEGKSGVQTSGTRQLQAAVGALGEQVQGCIVGHHKAELHLAELSPRAWHHQVEVAGCRPGNVAVLMLHSAGTRHS